jgi:hypothetical protein
MRTNLLDRIREHLPRTAEEIADRQGFLTPDHVRLIAGIDKLRLELLLVRCGAGRFLAPAQDVAHFVKIIGREGSDYVRDVGLPAERGGR